MKNDTRMNVRVSGRIERERPELGLLAAEAEVCVPERKSAYTVRLVAVRSLHCATTACSVYTRLYRLHCAMATLLESPMMISITCAADSLQLTYWFKFTPNF